MIKTACFWIGVLGMSSSWSVADAQTFMMEPDAFQGNAPFCREPDRRVDPYSGERHCKYRNDRWDDLTRKQIEDKGFDFTWHQREMTHECGPSCRPSCITLMLDLDKLAYESQVTCTANELCHCAHARHSSNSCTNDRLESLFNEHPKCYLEDADCLGPTLYDNKVKKAIDLQPGIIELTGLQQCDSLPDKDLYCRFQDWKVLNPIEKDRCRDGSFPDCLDEGKIYWEYCNIIEEDPACDLDEDCTEDGRCGRNCAKIIEPFPSGWTTFVVSAAIPFQPEWNPVCAEQMPLVNSTNSACFLQRIEVYYPPDDEDCGAGCPHCHDCPLLSLGDKFGPLEVVGFGSGLHNQDRRRSNSKGCASCDSRDSLRCKAADGFECQRNLFNHDCASQSINCYTNEPLGLDTFGADGQCTFDGSLSPNATATLSDRGFVFATGSAETVTEEQRGALDPSVKRTLVALLIVVVLGISYCLGRRFIVPRRTSLGKEVESQNSGTASRNESVELVCEFDDGHASSEQERDEQGTTVADPIVTGNNHQPDGEDEDTIVEEASILRESSAISDDKSLELCTDDVLEQESKEARNARTEEVGIGQYQA